MKKTVICGSSAVVLGLLIFLGPIHLFKACDTGCCSAYPDCLWTIQAELGMGMAITAMGACILLFNDRKTQLGLAIGIFLTGLFTLLNMHVIMRGCASLDMPCHRVTFPALTAITSLLLAGSAVFIFTLRDKKEKPNYSAYDAEEEK